MHLQESGEMYLETIYILSQKQERDGHPRHTYGLELIMMKRLTSMLTIVQTVGMIIITVIHISHSLPRKRLHIRTIS